MIQTQLRFPALSMAMRPTAFKRTADVLSGTWVQVDANSVVLEAGSPAVPTLDPAKYSSRFVLEGTKEFVGDLAAQLTDANQFGLLPYGQVAGAITLVDGVFTASVGPQGYTTAAGSANPGDGLILTTLGLLDVIPGGGLGTNVIVATVVGIAGAELTFRTRA